MLGMHKHIITPPLPAIGLTGAVGDARAQIIDLLQGKEHRQFYDLTDPTTRFLSRAGTGSPALNPNASVGQVLGQFGDEPSFASSADDTARPRVSADGYGVQFTGSENDHLQFDFSGGAGPSDCDVFFLGSTVAQRAVLLSDTGSTNRILTLETGSSATDISLVDVGAEYYIQNAATAVATRGELYDFVSTQSMFIAEARGADLSTWQGLRVGEYLPNTNFNYNGDAFGFIIVSRLSTDERIQLYRLLAEHYRDVTTHNFTSSSEGFTASARELSVGGSLGTYGSFASFPAEIAYSSIFNGASDGIVSRSSSVSGSDWSATSENDPRPYTPALLTPWDGNALATEGSGISADDLDEAGRYTILFPDTYRRRKGLKITAEFQAQIPPSLQPRAILYAKNIGEDFQNWVAIGDFGLQAQQGQQTLSVEVPVGPACQLMLALEHVGTGFFPEGNFFDVGIDNIVIEETPDWIAADETDLTLTTTYAPGASNINYGAYPNNTPLILVFDLDGLVDASSTVWKLGGRAVGCALGIDDQSTVHFFAHPRNYTVSFPFSLIGSGQKTIAIEMLPDGNNTGKAIVYIDGAPLVHGQQGVTTTGDLSDDFIGSSSGNYFSDTVASANPFGNPSAPPNVAITAATYASASDLRVYEGQSWTEGKGQASPVITPALFGFEYAMDPINPQNSTLDSEGGISSFAMEGTSGGALIQPNDALRPSLGTINNVPAVALSVDGPSALYLPNISFPGEWIGVSVFERNQNTNGGTLLGISTAFNLARLTFGGLLRVPSLAGNNQPSPAIDLDVLDPGGYILVVQGTASGATIHIQGEGGFSYTGTIAGDNSASSGIDDLVWGAQAANGNENWKGASGRSALKSGTLTNAELNVLVRDWFATPYGINWNDI